MAKAKTKTETMPPIKPNADLDALFAIDNTNEPQGTQVETIPFHLMDDYVGHRFQLYEGERRSDFVNDLRQNGIVQPIILRPKEDGRYEILSGHNRRYCGEEAGLTEVPVSILQGLSDEDAENIVVGANVFQRSFNDMSISERQQHFQ